VNQPCCRWVETESPQLITPCLARIQAGDPRAAAAGCSPCPPLFFEWLALTRCCWMFRRNFRGGVALERGIWPGYLCLLIARGVRPSRSRCAAAMSTPLASGWISVPLAALSLPGCCCWCCCPAAPGACSISKCPQAPHRLPHAAWRWGEAFVLVRLLWGFRVGCPTALRGPWRWWGTSLMIG